MKDLLQIIKEELKYVHIEDGKIDSFNRVCNRLNDRITNSSVYKLGVKDGRNELKTQIRELLGIEKSIDDEILNR